MRYYDASAIVKRYVSEPGSEQVRRLMVEDAPPITGSASGAEVSAAIGRATRGGRLAHDGGQNAVAAFWRDWDGGFTTIALDESLALRAGGLAWELGLRGYDAVHLASAMVAAERVNEALVLVTFDLQMHHAARGLGLATYPGNLESFYAS